MKLPRVMMACMAVAMLSGCVKMKVLPQGDPAIATPLSKPREANALEMELTKSATRTYRVGPRDVLRVDVRKDPTLSQVYPVTAEGNILMPNVGAVRVADMTTSQIETRLNTVLSELIREPEVKVGVQEYLSKVIYVVGQVANPGPQPMKADMLTVQEAIFGAGLPTPEASLKRTHVITPDYEKPVVRQVNLNDIIYKGRMAENVLLRPNDIVYVPSRYSTNLSAAIKELLVPFSDINDFRFRANLANDRGNGNNNSSRGGGFLGF